MMKRILSYLLLIYSVSCVSATTLTYTALQQVNLRDLGIPADERATNILIASGTVVYGATSGDRCHVFRFDPKSEKQAYLGTLTLGGEWLTNVVLQGIALDINGNLALHCLDLKLTDNQKKLAHWQPGTVYRDIEEKPQFLGFPGHLPGTYYSVVYIRDAVSIK